MSLTNTSTNDDLHIPWDRESLRELLLKIISTGETTKVDLKATFDISDTQHQAEMLKDISALANTYSHYYRNHGFIVFGASNNKLTYSVFPNNEDHLQATIDDLLKKYIGPFITTHLFIFDDLGNKWGVLVVPPTRNAPHVFFNEIHKRYRGDVYVRNGTTSEKAQPSDFTRFFRQHLEEHTYEFQQTISDLQRQVSDLSSQIKKIKNYSSKTRKDVLVQTEQKSEVEKPILQNQTITEKIDSLLEKEEDQVTKGLFEEAKKINTFIESQEIPWAISSVDKVQSQEIINKIESVSKEFWLAIISLVLKDQKGTYDDAIVKSISYLARQIEPPSGVSYTELGRSARYYPLFVALYLIFIGGVAKKRDKLLKRILKINLLRRSHYDEPLPITYILFMIRRGPEIFHPLYDAYPDRKWCDPIASYTKILVDRLLNPDDPLWDKESEFYRGEFLLCISPMDILDKTSKRPMIGHPSAGLYIYINSSIPIITRLLRDEKDWIRKVFDRSLEDLLSEFDKTAQNLGRGSTCWADGFQQGALEIAFPEKAKPNK